MFSLLLAIIYLAFISLGLPDSLLGAVWPLMGPDIGAPLSYAGILSIITSVSTVFSSVFSDKLTHRLGAGKVTAISTLLSALAIFGFSVAEEFWVLCLLSIPYGIGAGAIDAALNNYVALHYASRHMSWLHCFWGLGATLGPYVMSTAIALGHGWRGGYGVTSIIQGVFTLILFLSLPLWKKKTEESGIEEAPIGVRDALRIPGVPAAMISFFAYCALETSTSLWASSYLVEHRGIDAETATGFASLFFIGITAGRFLSGFISDRLGDKTMIRLCISVSALGFVLVVLPISSPIPVLIGLFTIGFGAAPTYPVLMHATPYNFGKENSHAIIGLQTASAYLGVAFMPPVFGFIAEHISISLYPFYLALWMLLLALFTERINRVAKGNNHSN